MNFYRHVCIQSATLTLLFFVAIGGAGIPNVASAQSFAFLQNHRLHDRGADIRALQIFLNGHGFLVAQRGPGSPGNETSTFGLLTYQALVRFQTAQHLPATGFLGPLTRATIATLLQIVPAAPQPSATLATSTAPSIVHSPPVISTPWVLPPGVIPGAPSTQTTQTSTSDTTPPTVSLTAPSNGATVSGTSVTLSATASDNVGVVGVQLKVDGANVGSEVTSSPYSITWDSTGVADGSHTVTAVARDAAGNTTTSSTVTVTVHNTPPVISSISVGTLSDVGVTITWTTNDAATSTVNYGLTTGYGTASTSAVSTTSHSISLTGLTAGTLYHFQVGSADAQGNVATSSDQTFTTYSAQSQAFFARLASQPNTSRKQAYDRAISGLVLTGVWAKLDGLYLLAAADAATAQTNLIQNSYGLAVVGSPAFAADAGYTGTGATSAYLSTGLNPTVGSPNFSLNSASLFAWKKTAPVGDAGLIAALSGENSYIQVFQPSDNYESAINAGGGGASGINLTAQTGLFGSSRTAGNLTTSYYAGVPLSNSSGAASMPSATIRFVGDGSATTISQVSAASMGAGLGAADVRNLNTYLTNYLNDISSVTPIPKYGYSSDVITNGANNFGPAIGRLKDGRVIVAYSVGSGLGVDGKIVYQTSSDNGLTWSAATNAVIPASGNNLDYPRITVMTDGSILLSYVDQTNAGGNNTTKIVKGTVAGDLSISWSALATVTSGAITHPAPCGPVLQLSNGNLMLGLTSLAGEITVVTSSDAGVTWGNEHVVTNDGGVATDHKFGFMAFVQKSNGTIIGILRNDPTTSAEKGYWVASSTDNGATWSSPTQLFQDTSPSEASLVVTPGGTLFLMARADLGVGGAFAVYSYSTDGGATWSALTRFYSFATKDYGQILESQGFYDSSTASVMFAVGLGSFTGAGEVLFQQFSLP
jgi:hypothetical protein